MKIIFGDIDRSGMSERERREMDYIDQYQRRRLAEEFAKDRRAEAAKPPLSWTKFLGFDR